MEQEELLSKINFLVVDDMSTMRTIVRNILRSFGAKTFVDADDGTTALEALENNDKIDFIICDWNMPNMSGLELLKKLRSADKYKDIAFLMVTAEQDVGQVKEAITAGVDGYIIKPFNKDMFSERLTSVLKKRF